MPAARCLLLAEYPRLASLAGSRSELPCALSLVPGLWKTQKNKTVPLYMIAIQALDWKSITSLESTLDKRYNIFTKPKGFFSWVSNLVFKSSANRYNVKIFRFEFDYVLSFSESIMATII